MAWERDIHYGVLKDGELIAVVTYTEQFERHYMSRPLSSDYSYRTLTEKELEHIRAFELVPECTPEEYSV